MCVRNFFTLPCREQQDRAFEALEEQYFGMLRSLKILKKMPCWLGLAVCETAKCSGSRVLEVSKP